MLALSRRDILKIGVNLAAVMGMSALAPQIAEAVEALAAGNVPVLWLQAQSCSGCSVSTLNSDKPGPAQILTQLISLRFNATLSAATGHQAVEVINKTIEEGGFYLVVEGAIPTGMPEACVVGDEPVTRQIQRAASKCKAIVALGTCAVFGGIPAAENNPTGAVRLSAFLASQKIDKPTISIPGCPPHPDWLVGTLAHLVKFGLPALDKEGRPLMFFSRVIHDQCPRFADYERERFAKTFSDNGCLFQLGCLGPNTKADCTLRSWNSGVNSCIRAGAPCVGCASELFAAKKSLAFYPREELAATARRKLEESAL
jgi:hydrogenase small subunit